jgi:hypothetical protein
LLNAKWEIFQPSHGENELLDLFLYIVHTSKTYILSGSVTSSIVCGNGLPAVSGRNNANPPANTDNPR